MKIRFIGALGTVTGSCTLLTHRHRYYLVDCGATQGNDANASRITKLLFKASGIAGVFLTHAHLDHCGLLPELVKQGFQGRVYCTRATADLTKLALSDASTLPNSGFTPGDVEKLHFDCLDDRPEFQFGKSFGVDANFSVSLIRTSHVLGSVGFEFQFSKGRAGEASIRKTIVFSGDIGCNTDANCYQPLLNARQYPSTHAEYIVCESTYGGRQRLTQFASFDERMQALKQTVLNAAARGFNATLIFPCFTMQRMQDLQMDLHYLFENHLDSVDLSTRPEIIIDSPLSKKYGEVFARELLRRRDNGKYQYLNPDLASRLKIEPQNLPELFSALFGKSNNIAFRSYDLKFGTPVITKPQALRIILAGSGMCGGGRVMEHLKCGLPWEGTTVVITGYQSPGTPGAELAKRISNPAATINGSHWELKSDAIKATVVDLAGFYSGHADENGLLEFLFNQNSHHPYQTVKRVFLVHGDNQARNGLRRAIEEVANRPCSTNRKIVDVDLPTPENRWFDLEKGRWVWDYHPQVEFGDEAIVSGFGRLQKLELMITELCERTTNGEALNQVTSQLNMAKLQLAQAQQAGSCSG